MALWNNKEVDEKINKYTVELEQKIQELESKLLTANAKISELDAQLEQRTTDFEARMQAMQAQMDEKLADKGAKVQEQAVQTANQAKDFVAVKLGQASQHLNDVDFRDVGEKIQEKGNRLFDKLKTMAKPTPDSTTPPTSDASDAPAGDTPTTEAPTVETPTSTVEVIDAITPPVSEEVAPVPPVTEVSPVQAKETVIVDHTDTKQQ